MGREDQKLSVSEIAALNVEKREYQKQYMEYWNSTVELTGTGRPVDAVISPLAVHAASIPGKLNYEAGYSGIINVLDYSTVIIPVTYADKTIDVPLSADKYLGIKDGKSQQECRFSTRSVIDLN